MSEGSERSLKSLNMKWLAMLAVADAIVIALLAAPGLVNEASLTRLVTERIAVTALAPLIVLLVVNVIPSDLKAMVVYWKPRGVLPGCQAFSKYGPRDPRINMFALEKSVGPSPVLASEQNAKWYKLYKKVQNETEVRDAHKLFLLYREIAAFSLPLAIAVPVALLFLGASTTAVWLSSVVLLVQYLLAALSARWCGIGFVCHVLAAHSVTGD